MSVLFLVLTGLSVVALLVGTVWTAVVFGQTRWRSGSEAEAEFMAEQRIAFFKGKAVAVDREATFTFAEIKQRLKTGQWQPMFPVLLALGGFVGLFFFGAVTAWLGIENKLVAAVIALLALYALIRTLIYFVRA